MQSQLSRRTVLNATAGLGAFVLALTGCTQGSATNTSDQSVDGSSGPVTVSFMNFSASGGHEQDLQSIADAFTKANPDVKIQIENVPYADYFTKLQTAVAGGTASDVFELNYENFVTYAKSGALAELKDVDESLYRASLVDAFKIDGKQFGLPTSFSNVVLFYNKDLFKAGDIAEPDEGWTWADEMDAGKQLTDPATGVWGDYQPVSFHEFYKALAQAGGSFLSDDGKRAMFNSPEGIKAAQWLVEKSGESMPTEEDGAGTPDFDSKLFKDGKLAMWHSGIWMFDSLQDTDFEWDVVVEPGDTVQASAMFANGVVVNAQSKKAEAAQRWVTFLTSSKEMVDTRLGTSWELPPVSDDAAFSSYLDKGKPENRKAVLDSLDATVLPPVIEAQQEMQDIVDEELSAVAAGRKPVEQALADAETQVNALLK